MSLLNNLSNQYNFLKFGFLQNNLSEKFGNRKKMDAAKGMSRLQLILLIFLSIIIKRFNLVGVVG